MSGEAKALEHMDKALVTLANDESDKAVDEYRKAWEEALKAGTFNVVGFRGEYLGVVNSLVAAMPGLTGKALDKAGDAVNELGKAYAGDEVWDAVRMPSDGEGKDAFDKAKRAVEKLREVDNPPPAVAISPRSTRLSTT